MTLTEARKILGLGMDEDPRPQLGEFKVTREKIAEMVRTAPNEQLGQRYQEGLVEFDRALAAVREYLEALGLVPKEDDVAVNSGIPPAKGHAIFVDENRVKEPVGLPLLSQDLPELEIEEDEIPSGRAFRTVCWLFLLLTIVGFGVWTYYKIEEEKYLEKQERVAFLERQGAAFIENRRWPEAREAFDEIHGILPDSELVTLGRRSIEAGMMEEQSQFIGYWKGEAIASFEASRWSDAESAGQQVLDKYPDEKEIVALMDKIGIAKQEEERQEAFDGIRKQVEERKYDEALNQLRGLAEKEGGDEEAVALMKETRAAQEKAAADLVKARQLLAQAVENDNGEFNEEALKWIREAVSLAPDDAEILARYEKMAAYTRTIRVPEDVKTLQEALAKARDRDRLVLGEGTWEGSFVISAAVELEGVSGKTIVQCAAETGSVISVELGVHGARVSGLTLRHISFDAGEERFSLALVQGANVDFSDCRFEQGSGHGLAIAADGHAKVTRCKFSENGWNGISVAGSGSLLEAEGNTLKENYQNGIESWDGATLIASKNTCTSNSRNGIHVDNGAASATVLDNVLSENREFGVVISSAESGRVAGNTIEKNILGGMVAKVKVRNVTVTDNTIQANQGPGLVLEKGVAPENYLGNRITGNAGNQLMTDVDLSGKE